GTVTFITSADAVVLLSSLLSTTSSKMSLRTMTRYWPAADAGKVVFKVSVYTSPGWTGPECVRLSISRSLISHVASVERNRLSVQEPLAGLGLSFLTFHVNCTGCPACAEAGTVTERGIRSAGGGMSKTSGVAVWAVLLASLSASYTSPRGLLGGR